MISNDGLEVISARSDEKRKAAFIVENENFILNCANRFCKRFITKSDDEWSIALIAFNTAMDTYDVAKGNFMSYARLLIERRLTDYVRVNAKFSANEIEIEPYVFEGNVDEDSENAAFQANIVKTASTTDENPLRDEIVALTGELKEYDITFMELTTVSPKAAKTKAMCKEIVAYMISDEVLVTDMKNSGHLPVKNILKKFNCPPKILERHRKYILAAVIIASGDYPMLADYLK